jgi:hypothetical protein
MKRKMIFSALLGLSALLASAATIGIFQVCLVKSLFLHATVVPLNPQTIARPTGFTSVSVLCQFLIPTLFLIGIMLVLRSMWLLFSLKKLQENTAEQGAAANP